MTCKFLAPPPFGAGADKCLTPGCLGCSAWCSLQSPWQLRNLWLRRGCIINPPPGLRCSLCGLKWASQHFKDCGRQAGALQSGQDLGLGGGLWTLSPLAGRHSSLFPGVSHGSTHWEDICSMLFILWYFPGEIRLWFFLVNDFSTQTYTIYEDTLSLRHNVEPVWFGCWYAESHFSLLRTAWICRPISLSLLYVEVDLLLRITCESQMFVYKRQARLLWLRACSHQYNKNWSKQNKTKLNLRLEDERGTLALCCLVQIWKQVVSASRIVWGDSLSPANPVTSPLVTDTFWPLWVPGIHIMHRCTYGQTLIYI